MKCALFLIISSCLAGSLVMGQEPVKTEPKTYKVAEVDTTGAVSPDGRFLTYTDWSTGDLAVRDLKTGENRRPTNKGSWLESGEFALFSAVSPDGKQVVYAWFNKDGFYDLRIIGADGSNPRTLYRDKETYPWPMDWSLDGKHILASFQQNEDRTWQIALVSVADGSVQVVKSLDWRSPLKVSYSPDGHFIAYDLLTQEDGPGRDIFLLPLDTGEEIPLVQHPANDLLLGWAPDGSGILFASDRRGTLDAWLLPAADGKPLQTPELVQQDLGPNVVALGFDRKGTYYYGISADLANLYVATLDPTTGKVQPSPKKLSPAANNSSPAWSPDGQQLAYLQRRGAGAWDLYTSVLLIRSVKTSKERSFPLKLSRYHDFRLQWSPDGTALLAQGRDHTLRQGFYRIEAGTGRVTPLVQAPTRCPNDCLEWPTWSPSGKLIFTRRVTDGQTIVVRDLETGEENELLSVRKPSFVGPLIVSPDGRRVAYVWRDLQKGTSVLTVTPAAGGEPRELLRRQPPEGIGDLGWMPDSRRIVYATRTSGEERKFELWRISAEGGEPQSLGLTMEGLSLYGLSVHPDGRRIAFTAGRPHRNEVWVLENFLPALKAAK
jgi:Tol biopolymer transport system component